MAADETPSSQGKADSTPEPPDETILKPALRLLSARARSTKELRGRLLEKGFASDDVSRCIEWLVDRELLNDESFAKALVRDRVRFSPRSVFLLERELTRRGVGSSLAQKVVETVFEEEGVTDLELSRRVAEGWVRRQSRSARSDLLGKRFSPGRERARRRLHGFLSRRGFGGEAGRQGLEAGEEKARELED